MRHARSSIPARSFVTDLPSSDCPRAFAGALHIPVNRATQILREQRGISADTALRLGCYFSTSPEFWMDLQSDYKLRRARREVGQAIEQTVCPRAA